MAKNLLEPPAVAFPVGLALLARPASALDGSSVPRQDAVLFLPRRPLAESLDVSPGAVHDDGPREYAADRRRGYRQRPAAFGHRCGSDLACQYQIADNR
jgi:hypothetical protein